MHADRHGVVKDLSLGDFSKLTGMLSDRLESQFIIITGLGYLLSRVAGLTNKALFGQVKSVFYLNVYNDNLLASKDKPVLLLTIVPPNHHMKYSWAYLIKLWLQSPVKIFPYMKHKTDNQIDVFIRNAFNVKNNLEQQYPMLDDTNLAKDLPQLLKSIKKLFEAEGLYFYINHKSVEERKNSYSEWIHQQFTLDWLSFFYFFKIEELFSSGLTTEFFNYLQLKINEYACELLNDVFWQKKDNDDWHQYVYMQPSILAKIRADLFPTIKSHDDIMNETKKSALEFFIYCIAYHHALEMKALVEYILPSTLDDDYSLSMLPANNSLNCNFAYLQIISIYSKNRLYDESCIVKCYSTLDSKIFSIDIAELDEGQMKKIGYDLKKLVS